MDFRLYNNLIDKDIDAWGKSDYSNYSEFVNKYALFGDNISSINEWYKNHPGEISDIFDQIVVVLEKNEKLAVIVFNYFHDEDKNTVLGFNPIIVNPKYMHKGYGKRIISEIIKLKGNILNMEPTFLYAGIDDSNIACKKVFEQNGFKLVGNAPNDKNFLYYKFRI